MQTERARSVLVVDDDAENREILARLLDLEGYAVVSFGDGAVALEWLRSNPAPSVILLDLNMPNVNGWEFSRRLREDPAIQRIPIVVISASTQVRQGAREIGASEYLDKPIDFDRLIAALGKSCA